MYPKILSAVLTLITVFAFSPAAHSGHLTGSEIRKRFIKALDESNTVEMAEIIKENKEKIPAEIKTLLDEAMMPAMAREEREENYNLAEAMAKEYKDETGDLTYLIGVKKTIFNSKLSQPVRAAGVNGVHTVNMPRPADNLKNMFKPDNMIIKKGETVRWINSDTLGHVFYPMLLINAGPIPAMRKIEPGQGWEHKFDKPGEYYYICFIHRSMIGKITVEE